MLLGAVADDFTGASDLANTLARGGMRTVQFIGPGDAVDCEAGVVALKTRSAPVAEAVRQSVEAARWLMGQGCRQILFKYCSTFNSTPQGNIGPVAEALAGGDRGAARGGMSGVSAGGPANVHGAPVRRGPVAQRIGHGASPADADDRPRHPPLAAAADPGRGRASAARHRARRHEPRCARRWPARSSGWWWPTRWRMAIFWRWARRWPMHR